MSNKILPKWTFYLLSWTWGIVMTLIGHVAAGILLLLGYRPQKNCYGWTFEIGYGYGGIDLGYISIICKDNTQYLKDHEFLAIQFKIVFLARYSLFLLRFLR